MEIIYSELHIELCVCARSQSTKHRNESPMAHYQLRTRGGQYSNFSFSSFREVFAAEVAAAEPKVTATKPMNVSTALLAAVSASALIETPIKRYY